jgi:hypothetical protein
MSATEQKDQLLFSLFEELKKLREENKELSKKIEELSNFNRSGTPVSLSELRGQIDKTQALSNDTGKVIDRAVTYVMEYAKKVNFI